MQKSTLGAQREGLGFLVDNLLSSEFDNKHDNNDVKYNDDSFDKIKRSIVELYKKINRRKMYNSNNNNNNNNNSYINHSKIREQYRELLTVLHKTINEKTNDSNNNKDKHRDKHRAQWHAIMLYRLLAFTRDISEGCGERELAYMQLFEWARVDATLASYALHKFVTPLHEPDAQKTNPLGSWKDVKGLVAYMRRTMNMRDDRDMAAYLAITNFSISMVNDRLAKDVLAFYKDDNESDKDDNESDKDDNDGDDLNDKVSFAAKWIPRENKSKKYGNFYERLACDYYKTWLPKDRNANPVSYEKAVVKCKIHYRKLISFLNRYLDTPQIKMCDRNWSDLVFSQMTRQTRDAQDSALKNVKSDEHGCKRYNSNADRDECAEKYKVWKCDMLNYRNGISTDLETHIRVAEYYSGCVNLASNRNAEWAAFASQATLATNLQRVIPVLVGSSYKAIGLALATAANALTGPTIILEDGSKEFFVLHDLDASFVKNVNGLLKRQRDQEQRDQEQRDQEQQQHDRNNQNLIHNHALYKCLTSVLKLLIESNVSAKQTKQMKDPFTIMIFADDDMSPYFNMGDCDTCFKDAWNEAALLYGEFGYAVPNVVLWAMKSVVRHEHHNNNDNYRFQDHEVSYNSMSHGGALQIRAGCNPSDICTYLGINWNVNNKNNDNNDNFYARYNNMTNNNMTNNNMTNNNMTNEWTNEWNDLVEKLYNPRYFDFEQYFWKQ